LCAHQIADFQKRFVQVGNTRIDRAVCSAFDAALADIHEQLSSAGGWALSKREQNAQEALFLCERLQQDLFDNWVVRLQGHHSAPQIKDVCVPSVVLEGQVVAAPKRALSSLEDEEADNAEDVDHDLDLGYGGDILAHSQYTYTAADFDF